MEMLKGKIDGLQASLKSLRETERLFIKANALDEQIEKAGSDRAKIEENLEEIKSDKAGLKALKSNLMDSVCGRVADAITELLPEGAAAVRIEDGKLFIGRQLTHDGPRVSYLGLSGGERVLFDAALSNALLNDSDHKVLVVEAAECDQESLSGILLRISGMHPDCQVIVNAWFDFLQPEELPEGWDLVRLG